MARKISTKHLVKQMLAGQKAMRDTIKSAGLDKLVKANETMVKMAESQAKFLLSFDYASEHQKFIDATKSLFEIDLNKEPEKAEIVNKHIQTLNSYNDGEISKKKVCVKTLELVKELNDKDAIYLMNAIISDESSVDRIAITKQVYRDVTQKHADKNLNFDTIVYCAEACRKLVDEEDLFDMFSNDGGRNMENETAKDNTLLMQQNILT